MPAKTETVLDALLAMRTIMLRVRIQTDYSEPMIRDDAKQLDARLARLIDLLAAKRAQANLDASKPRSAVNSASIANRLAR